MKALDLGLRVLGLRSGLKIQDSGLWHMGVSQTAPWKSLN